MLFTNTTLIFVALWTCLIAHKSVCSRIILNMKTFKIVRWSIKFWKKTPFELKERFTCVSRVPWMYEAILTNDGSIISSSWERLARLSHHLGKGRLIEWTAQPLKPRCKFFRCVYRDFVWFHQLKNHSFHCLTNSIHETFSMVGPVIVPLKLYCLIKVCH